VKYLLIIICLFFVGCKSEPVAYEYATLRYSTNKRYPDTFADFYNWETAHTIEGIGAYWDETSEDAPFMERALMVKALFYFQLGLPWPKYDNPECELLVRHFGKQGWRLVMKEVFDYKIHPLQSKDGMVELKFWFERVKTGPTPGKYDQAEADRREQIRLKFSEELIVRQQEKVELARIAD